MNELWMGTWPSSGIKVIKSTVLLEKYPDFNLQMLLTAAISIIILWHLCCGRRRGSTKLTKPQVKPKAGVAGGTIPGDFSHLFNGSLPVPLTCRALLQRLQELFAEDKLMLAAQCLQEVERRLRAKQDGASRAMMQDLLQAQKEVNKAPLLEMIQEVRRRSESVEHVRSKVSSDDGWTLQRDSNGIRTLYQESDVPGVLAARIEGFVPVSVFNVLALLYEVDLWHLWVPSLAGLGLGKVRIVTSASPTRMIYHGEVLLPWPFQNRDFLIAVEGVDCMNPGDPVQQIQVLLDSSAAYRYPASCVAEIPAETKEFVRIDLMNSGLSLTPSEVLTNAPDGFEGTFMQIMVSIDVKMTVPKWLLNLAIRQLSPMILVRIGDAVKLTLKEVYQSRMCDPANPFYALVRRRLAEALPGQAAMLPPLRGQIPFGKRSIPDEERDHGCARCQCG
eukprot:gnl/MRDRNA2_/MRDRNA2_164934_c0_seq1.p1 gnl/MRDRNA2_/MRDRNA2_164934_c0~~gnl/MRDRNA2_/MRDRNA2_164934_c0_seq1.p1  ORF type:complete len:446 (+),score=83.40 gnl/MRDRNA2_/MRDRNA2_164934_c0_seq1:155-1492(+)